MKYSRLRSSYGKSYGEKVTMPTPYGNLIQANKNFLRSCIKCHSVERLIKNALETGHKL